jgi:HEAT repeat protein
LTAEPDRLNDEQVLRAAGLSTEGPKLLDFLRKRTAQTADADQIRTLVAQLSDASVEKRERAVGALVAIGQPAVVQLRAEARDIDNRDLNLRVRRCLDNIETQVPLTIPAIRLIARRRPEGAIETILAFLPTAENDAVLEESRKTLLTLAVRDGKADPVLLAALKDKLSVRRANAAEVLTQLGSDSPEAELRLLLKDPVPSVRLRVALSLARASDEEGIAELIQLLGELPPPQAKPAEDFLVDLAQEQSPQAPLGNDEASRHACRDKWADWWKANEGENLLEEFRKRTLTDADKQKVLALIEKLGDLSYEEREQATTALSGMNYKIAPLLRTAVESTDLEVHKRAEKCLQAVNDGKDRLSSLSSVTARLVAMRKPAAAAGVLLDFLSIVDDEPAMDQVLDALATVAVRNGSVDPVLVKGLSSKEPRRRATAAAALAFAGAKDQLADVRKMLEDSDKNVRLEVALALAGGTRDKQAIPVLLALLPEVDSNRALRIDDYLRLVAGDKAPIVSVGAEEKDRKKCQEVWSAWWKENEKTVELVSSRPQIGAGALGYTMVLIPDAGMVQDLGRDGKVRWEIQGLSNPFAAQILPRDRVLLAEIGAGRVTERSSKGDILWQKQIPSPVGCQRLSNGNTLIVCTGNLVEVDRAGNQVFSRLASAGHYWAAAKSRTGQLVCLNGNQTCQILDGEGKEISSFHVPNQINHYNGMEVEPNGRILIAHLNSNKVCEYDQAGKVVWEANIAQPMYASRLPNGNTLVALNSPGKVVEIDRAGKTLWEYSPPNQWRTTVAQRH